jgi:exopolyphosphatase/guanosine-5'-triphosphate,3'-diphosphate pyrophosphatase
VDQTDATDDAAADVLAPEAVIHAAVDAGSNSVHLLVASIRGHDLETLVDESVFLGLARRVDAAGSLGAEARDSLTSVLAGYVATARARGAQGIVLLGTEPFRRASDAARAVGQIELATGSGFHVISHDEEAYLTLVGVTCGRPLEAELAVVDIGGGSTEVVDARPGSRVSVDAVPIGSARLTAAVIEHDPPTRREVEALRVEAAEHVAALPGSAARDIVAAGGTASNLAKVLDPIVGAPDGGRPTADRYLTRPRLAEALELLLAAPSQEVAERHALNPVRARVLPAGAAILGAILDRYGVDVVRVADEGLREGAVLAMAHAGASWRDRLPSLVMGWE